MFVVMGTFVGAGGLGGLSPESYRPAARVMLAVIVLGVGVLWPMTRLSQRRPEGSGAGAATRDMVVMLIPVQAVIWPQTWLAHWPIGVVASVAALVVAWSLLIGGVLGLVLERGSDRGGREPGHGARAGAMAVCVALSLGGAVVPLVAPSRGGPPEGLDARWTWMLSPVTGIYELTRDRAWSGRSAAVGAAHREALLATFAIGGATWATAVVSGAVRRRTRARD